MGVFRAVADRSEVTTGHDGFIAPRPGSPEGVSVGDVVNQVIGKMDGQDFSRAIVLGGLGGLVELVSLLILFVFPRPGGCCTGISAPPGVTITCSCSAITATSSYTYLGAAIGVVVGLILLGWAIVMARQAKKYPDADIRELR